MVNSRFLHRDVLVTYDLDIEFLKQLELNIKEIIPLRKVYILITDKGKKILKKIDYDLDKLTFINTCLNELAKYYSNIISFYCFSDGSYYKEWNDNIYVIMDLLDGREGCFSNEIEYTLAGENIAKMHIGGKNAVKDICRKLNKKINDIIDVDFIQKIEESQFVLKDIYNFVSKYQNKNAFDDLFINTYNEKIHNMEQAKKILYDNDYTKYYEEQEDVVICHNDLVEHNFIINGMNMSLIDFDYLSINYRIMDVANMIIKGIKHTGYEYSKGMAMLNKYSEIWPLKKNELIYVYALLQFPQDYYIITKNYYYKEKKWEYETFLNRYNQKIIEDKYKLEFLSQYKKWMKA